MEWFVFGMVWRATLLDLPARLPRQLGNRTCDWSSSCACKGHAKRRMRLLRSQMIPTTMVPPGWGGWLGPNEMAWLNQGGAGWNVDCSSQAIPVSQLVGSLICGQSYPRFTSIQRARFPLSASHGHQASLRRSTIKSQDTGRTRTSVRLAKQTEAHPQRSLCQLHRCGLLQQQSNLLNSFQIIIPLRIRGFARRQQCTSVLFGHELGARGRHWFNGCGTDPGVIRWFKHRRRCE